MAGDQLDGVGTAVVTVVDRSHAELEALRDALGRGSRAPGLLVVVAVEATDLIGWDPDDGVPVHVMPMTTTEGGVPWAAAKNAGAGAALRREAELVVFVAPGHEVASETLADLEQAARDHGEGMWWPSLPGGDGGAEPGAVFAITRGAWSQVGGFFEGYVGPGPEDADLHRAVARCGLSVGVAGETDLAGPDRLDRSDGGEPGDAGERDARRENAELFASRWGDPPPARGGGW